MLFKQIGLLDNPIPSAKNLAELCYPNFKNIIENIKLLLDKKIDIKYDNFKGIQSDQPNKNFMGPF